MISPKNPRPCLETSITGIAGTTGATGTIHRSRTGDVVINSGDVVINRGPIPWVLARDAEITAAPTDLVVIQPTPFCNLDCSYCYLPSRSSRTRIQPETLEAVVRFLEGVPELKESLPIVWHAGEPMVMPQSFYEGAFAIVASLEKRGVEPVHNFQTNGTLITASWCEFLKRHRVRVGISIDGPQVLHDQNRKDRAGRGSFARVMRGIELLRSYEIPFSVIAVLGANSVASPETMWEFIHSNDFVNVGFNVQEIEGANQTSTLNEPTAEAQYEAFFEYMYERQRERPNFRIREIADTSARLCSLSGQGTHSTENAVGAILNFDVSGGVSTFPPELLTAPQSKRYGSFVWANVHTNNYDKFLRNLARTQTCLELRAGIEACKRECGYFAVCGGGAPSNKLAELGTFSGTETMSCRLEIKALTRVILKRLELEVEHAVEREGTW